MVKPFIKHTTIVAPVNTFGRGYFVVKDSYLLLPSQLPSMTIGATFYRHRSYLPSEGTLSTCMVLIMMQCIQVSDGVQSCVRCSVLRCTTQCTGQMSKTFTQINRQKLQCEWKKLRIFVAANYDPSRTSNV